MKKVFFGFSIFLVGDSSLINNPVGNHSSCIHHLRLDICIDKYSYHDSLQASLIEGFGHLTLCKAIAIETFDYESLFKVALYSISQSFGY